MAYQIEFSSTAIQDVDRIFEWIKERSQSLDVAAKWLDDCYKVILIWLVLMGYLPHLVVRMHPHPTQEFQPIEYERQSCVRSAGQSVFPR